MTTHRPLSRAIVLGFLSSVLATVIPHAARCQETPPAPAEKLSARTGRAGKNPPSKVETLRAAEAQLKSAQEWLKGQEASVAEARTILKSSTARREYHEVVRDNLGNDSAWPGVDRQKRVEAEKRVRRDQADERAARTHITVREGYRDHAAAKVHEAEALLDIARLESQQILEARNTEAIKNAQARAAEARLAGARAWLKATRAELKETQERPDSVEGERDHATAKVHEAEALLDIARLESQQIPGARDAKAIKKARTRAAEARLDGARAWLKAARAGAKEAQERPDSDKADVEEALASLKHAEAQLRAAETDADLPAPKPPAPPPRN